MCWEQDLSLILLGVFLVLVAKGESAHGFMQLVIVFLLENLELGFELDNDTSSKKLNEINVNTFWRKLHGVGS